MDECVFCHGHGFFGHTNADGEWDEIICTNCNAYYDQILSTRKTVTPPANDPLAAALAQADANDLAAQEVLRKLGMGQWAVHDEAINTPNGAIGITDSFEDATLIAAAHNLALAALNARIAVLENEVAGLHREASGLFAGFDASETEVNTLRTALETERAAHEETRMLAAEALKPLVDLFTEWDTECDTMA